MSARAHRANDTQVMIRCPGCGFAHAIDQRWTFNGDFERPTFSPSLLIRTGHYVPGQPADCVACRNGERLCSICHSFITAGRIQFLGDSTHKLSGQTVELPEWS